jgi:hypothetical protein
MIIRSNIELETKCKTWNISALIPTIMANDPSAQPIMAMLDTAGPPRPSTPHFLRTGATMSHSPGYLV